MVGIDTTVLVHLEILESAEHLRAHEWLRSEILNGEEQIALVPQVLLEFIHVVTDSKRFQTPLTMDEALARARFWWNAVEVRHVYPTSESSVLFFDWMAKHGLGRKRLLDTFLAATLWTAGVRRIASGNVRDFSLFAGFEVVLA
ncbi:MAG TPA: PIN domain-containing protein [Phycisphaerae bacterium]|nr:PIN domain-containing protein [Phycisphaerae bacterium]